MKMDLSLIVDCVSLILNYQKYIINTKFPNIMYIHIFTALYANLYLKHLL